MKTTYTNEQLQEAIDRACKDTQDAHPEADNTLALKPYFFSKKWNKEQAVRLTLARAFLDNLPEHHLDVNLYRIKPEPETFEAHGKAWIKPSVKKPEDDALIEWLLDSELEDRREYKAGFTSTAERLGHWGGIAGWRYADEPLVTSPEWTPQAGDVVRLKSGGPLMTVGCPIEHTIPSVSCAWFDGTTLCSTPIPTACLELSTKEDPR